MLYKIKVPRPALGIQVLLPNEKHPAELVFIDTYRKTFDVKKFGEMHPLEARLSLDTEYEPAPTRKNFETAIEQWDYYYNSSDNQDKVDEGLAQAYALEEMFKKLNPEDQLYFKKIKGILVGVETR